MKRQNNWSDVDPGKITDKIDKNKGKVVLGIDGFIDQVWQLLEERYDRKQYQVIKHMQQFGKIIREREQGGISKEVISKRSSCGGFTANTGRPLGCLGLDPLLIGMFGEPIQREFQELNKRCKLISLGASITCNILEFDDGKIMMPHLQNLLDLDWSVLEENLGRKRIKEIFAEVDLVSLGYWANMPQFDNILNKLLFKVFSYNPPGRLYFDFGNLTKRNKKDLYKTINLLADINKITPVTLSLNKHEARILFDWYHEKFSDKREVLKDNVIKLKQTLGIDELVIHTPYYTLAAQADIVEILSQDYCENPAITTGAGDTFNGGYIAGYIFQTNCQERLAIANATASFYVNQGRPPEREELIKEITRLKKLLR